jgi:hypothetical protein
MTWALGVIGPLYVGYGLFVAWTGWLPRWLAGRYEPRLSGIGTALQGAAVTWLWVVAVRQHHYGPAQVPPVILFALGLLAAAVAGMQLWRRRFDRTTTAPSSTPR